MVKVIRRDTYPRDAAILARDGEQIGVFHLNQTKYYDTADLIQREALSDRDQTGPELGRLQSIYNQGAQRAGIHRTGDEGNGRGSDSFAATPTVFDSPGFRLAETSFDPGRATGFEPTDASRAARRGAQTARGVGEDPSAQTNIGRDQAASSRPDVADGQELTGDGRSFGKFFAEVTNDSNEDYKPINPYRPAIPLGDSTQAFKETHEAMRRG